ncbi:MAG: TolC family protein, partial [Betaproteobacteria bacterium]|nr:TolC family protein [Betaproteobacteria bacterium]
MRALRDSCFRLLRTAPMAVALAGCMFNQPPDQKTLVAEALPTVRTPGAWTATGAAAGPVRDEWLATFADATLASLVAEALASNLDLRVAAARVERASAYARQAGAILLPQVNALATGSFTGSDSGSAF